MMIDPPMQARCGAHCRTTGQSCLNFPMPNGRCRMHGGKSTGRPSVHGLYSKEGLIERKNLHQAIDAVETLMEQLLDSKVSENKSN